MDKDAVNKRYLSDNRRYADLINGFIFHGEQAIPPDSLTDMDSQSGIWADGENAEGQRANRPSKKLGRGKKRRRDLVRKAALGINFAVIGIEKQEEVHYLMPLRVMGYDAAEYERQAAFIRKKVRQMKEISGAEFLSGFLKDSRLYPCVTFVLYFGEKWDGSHDLHGIINFTDIPDALKKLINNYPLHLLDVKRLENTDVFRTDLKQVFDFIRYSENKAKLGELIRTDAAYRAIDGDAYDMIAAYTNANELVNAKKDYIKKGKVDMCKALKEMIDDGKKAGLEEGRKAGLEEGKRAGLEEGTQYLKRINSLNLKLSQDGRMNDLFQSFQDAGLQRRLLAEYHL